MRNPASVFNGLAPPPSALLVRVLDFRVASPRRGLPDAGRAGAVGDFARPAVGIGEPAIEATDLRWSEQPGLVLNADPSDGI